MIVPRQLLHNITRKLKGYQAALKAKEKLDNDIAYMLEDLSCSLGEVEDIERENERIRAAKVEARKKQL